MPEKPAARVKAARPVNLANSQTAAKVQAVKVRAAVPPSCFLPVERRWPGEPVTLIAGGPSLNLEDVEKVRGKTRVIAVNDACRLAPWADILYAADRPWWDYHKGVPDFPGEKWTQDKSGGDVAAARWGLQCVRSETRAGLSFDPAFIHQGANSGFQVLNIAVLISGGPIFLLGYDMQCTGGRAHWFGDHPPQVHRDANYAYFRRAYDQAAPELAAAGIDVINCSRETALTCFRRATIDEVL